MPLALQKAKFVETKPGYGRRHTLVLEHTRAKFVETKRAPLSSQVGALLRHARFHVRQLAALVEPHQRIDDVRVKLAP